MIRNLIPLFLLCLFSNLLSAQVDANGALATQPERYVAPVDANLRQEAVEVEYFASQLAQLKEAYAANNATNLIVRESALVLAMRNELSQLELKLAAQSAQTERRKSASSGQLTRAATPEEAPARDPLAEAVTPDEIRFETIQYTLAAFERHAFDPAKPEVAARDFAKLDQVLKIMQEALAELQAIRR
jgi:hypothetical protein